MTYETGERCCQTVRQAAQAGQHNNILSSTVHGALTQLGPRATWRDGAGSQGVPEGSPTLGDPRGPPRSPKKLGQNGQKRPVHRIYSGSPSSKTLSGWLGHLHLKSNRERGQKHGFANYALHITTAHQASSNAMRCCCLAVSLASSPPLD